MAEIIVGLSQCRVAERDYKFQISDFKAKIVCNLKFVI